ncbi:sulfotransferase family 2 domain-containing protein [Leucothrix mucor]|uniref:sulfotransferase family 2 domain-containing protein n=1 Tax=Leucothrix mucor TaxID=45248 RepID=UPI0003B5F725|nr:sulfotransferase family 2 domain-containing protein [Leucothrix mucor]
MEQQLKKTLVHLHIFKNAGSSLDKILRDSFGDQFMTFDKDNPGAMINCDELDQILNRNENISCLASHQIRMPLPVNFSRMIFPVFFIRHPIERIQSCFHFERDVQKRFPPDMTMEQYARSSLRNPSISAVINLQTATICDNRLMDGKLRTSVTKDVVDSAISALRNNAYSFGLVSHFDLSLKLIKHQLTPHFEQLASSDDDLTGSVHENFSLNTAMNTSEKLAYVKDNLSIPTYVQLLEALQPDLMLYEEAVREFEKRVGNSLVNLSVI